MLDTLRRASTGTVAKILFGVLVASFAIWGIGPVFRNYGHGSLAKVGSHEIQMADFQRAYQNELRQIQRQSGRHITPRAESIPGLPVQLAIDCGLSRHVGALWFQVRERDPYRRIISVFADYHAVDKTSETNALAILGRSREVCHGRLDAVYLDPASTARSGVGPAARGEFARVLGERITTTWPNHRVLEGLDGVRPERRADLHAARVIGS